MGGSVGLPAMTKKKKKEAWIGASLKMQSLDLKKKKVPIQSLFREVSTEQSVG